MTMACEVLFELYWAVLVVSAAHHVISSMLNVQTSFNCLLSLTNSLAYDIWFLKFCRPSLNNIKICNNCKIEGPSLAYAMKEICYWCLNQCAALFQSNLNIYGRLCGIWNFVDAIWIVLSLIMTLTVWLETSPPIHLDHKWSNQIILLTAQWISVFFFFHLFRALQDLICTIIVRKISWIW